MGSSRMGGWMAAAIAALVAGCAGAEAPRPVAAGAAQTTTATAAAEAYPLPEDGQIVDAVAVTVNGEVITLNDVFFPIRRQLRDAAGAASREQYIAEASKLVSDELKLRIREALVLQEAERVFSDAQKAYIDQVVEDHIRRKVLAEGGSRQQMDARLRAEGSSLEQATRTLRRGYLQDFYVHGQGVADPNIGRRELWQYYQSHRGDFTSAPKITMQILAMPFNAFEAEADPQRARQAAIDAAAAALERIRAGEDFGDVVRDAAVSTAYRSAQGGLWEAMAPGSFREAAVEEAALKGEPGQVSDVIIGETGAFVVKTLAVVQSRTVPFEQAQREIREILRDQASGRLAAQHIQDLYSRAVIIPNPALDRLIRQRAMQVYEQES
ncbi:MAG: hypothetical protein GX591_19035 [Planctomycetes bacterium]|nr:hypothetical protein [Planctomycetota bacterium]